MGIVQINPRAYVVTHKDATEEYLFVLSGGGNITIDGQTTTITQGDAVYMTANAEVYFQNDAKSPTRLIQFFAGPAPAAKYKEWDII